MKSRTSFFNLTALRKDITRFAPVWAIYLIGGLMIGLSSLSSSNYGAGEAAHELADSIRIMVVVNLAYAIINGELLFGDLFNNRLCNALHAFPLRRESWFITHTVAGLLFSFVPNLILSVSFLPFMGDMWYVSFLWLLGVTLTYVFFFGLSALSAMCTGNRVAMGAVYGLINFASTIAYWFVDTFYAPQLYGLHIREDGFLRFCPSVWATERELVEFQYVPINNSNLESGFYYDREMELVYDGLTDHWWYLAILAVLGVALLGAAVLLYRRRKLECAGDFVAFSWLKPIFSVVFTLSVGALFEMLGDEFFNTDYAFLVVGIILGYFVGQMLLQRTLRVFRIKAFAACAAIGVALLLSIGLTALDPLGLTRWTPDPDKVESVTISDSYYYEPEYGINPMVITDPALIEELVEIHGLLLEERVAVDSYPEYYITSYHASIHLTYKMADGRQIVRRYRYITDREIANKVNKFFSMPEFVLGCSDWDAFLDSITMVHVDGNQLVAGQVEGLMNAILADCRAGTMAQNRSYGNLWHEVNIRMDDNGLYLIIRNDCDNTIAWIKDNMKSEK